MIRVLPDEDQTLVQRGIAISTRCDIWFSLTSEQWRPFGLLKAPL